MKYLDLFQKIQYKWFAAKSLYQFFKYFKNWSNVWQAYRSASPLPPFQLRPEYGSLLINHGPSDDPIFLFREIFVRQDYTPSWFYQPTPKDTVIDLGANIGMFMLYLSSKAPGIKIHCFEPITRTRETLNQQIATNHLQQFIMSYPYAVSDQEKEVIFDLSDNSGHQSLFNSIQFNSIQFKMI